MKHLYTVTVETTFVFASESEDISEVVREFETDLRNEYGMRDELEEGEISACPLSYLPSRYNLGDCPWGNDGDKTILDLINEGAAPVYAKMLEEFNKLRTKP